MVPSDAMTGDARRYTVGLTGGIGSGKSSVARAFEERGIAVVDADALAHGLTQPGGLAMPEIRAAFGDDFVDARGAMDRARMRALVFADAAAKARLEGILHPLIRANGAAAWFGWPEDPEIESLRDQWIASDDLNTQKTLAARIERRAFETVPYAPAGKVEQPMAYRKNLTGMVLSPVQFFWNMEKK